MLSEHVTSCSSQDPEPLRGLTSAEAEHRLRIEGANELVSHRRHHRFLGGGGQTADAPAGPAALARWPRSPNQWRCVSQS